MEDTQNLPDEPLEPNFCVSYVHQFDSPKAHTEQFLSCSSEVCNAAGMPWVSTHPVMLPTQRSTVVEKALLAAALGYHGMLTNNKAVLLEGYKWYGYGLDQQRKARCSSRKSHRALARFSYRSHYPCTKLCVLVGIHGSAFQSCSRSSDFAWYAWPRSVPITGTEPDIQTNKNCDGGFPGPKLVVFEANFLSRHTARLRSENHQYLLVPIGK